MVLCYILYLERQKIIDAVQTDTFDGLFALYHLLLDKEKSDLRNYSHQHHQVLFSPFESNLSLKTLEILEFLKKFGHIINIKSDSKFNNFQKFQNFQ